MTITNLTDGQQALIQTIVGYSSKPVLGLPNGPVPEFSDSVTVRWVIQAAGGAQVGAGVDGVTQADPEINVRVETPADGYAGTNDASVKALCALFIPGTTVNGIRIQKAPMPRPPMPYAGVYSVPVIITGRTFF